MASAEAQHQTSLSDKWIVSGLGADYRHGQVFLTWQEGQVPAGTTFNVYVHRAPITEASIDSAVKLTRNLEPNSARDWWQDPASFSKNAMPADPIGFLIAPGGKRLNPHHGLYVHTITTESTGQKFFAITANDSHGIEDKRVRIGINSLSNPVLCEIDVPQPIWQDKGKGPAKGAGRGKPLVLSLHWRGGGATAGENAQQPGNYLVFGDAHQGWREGLAFKFLAKIKRDAVYIEPYDRAWTGGRPVIESPDERDHCPAVNTWWYGYHPRINESTHPKADVIPNYSEKFLLGLVRWAQHYLGTDIDRTYLIGTSMGGSGAISMALHHPTIFAAALSIQGAVAYSNAGTGTLRHLIGVTGPIDEKTTVPNGEKFIDYMNGAWLAGRYPSDLPYLFCTASRCDHTISWENNPPFYRTMSAFHQGLSAYWNNAGHDLEKDMARVARKWKKKLFRYSLKRSYPVFTNCSADQDPGDGTIESGDPTGWINQGLDWRDVVDTPEKFAMTVYMDRFGFLSPISVDITIRRIQHFRTRPGDIIYVRVDDQHPYKLIVDDLGLVQLKGIWISGRRGVRFALTRE